jgi:hypothetical protein
MEGIMSTLAKYTPHAKTILFAGAMLLTTLAAIAQQEVDPEHFDQPIVAQKTAAPKPHKQVATEHKPKAPKAHPPQSAVKNPQQQRVVTVAAR